MFRTKPSVSQLIRLIVAIALGAGFSAAFAPAATAQQESILDIVRRNDQREQAARAQPRRPPRADEFLRLPENNPPDYGSRPSTRPQYVRGLRGLQKQPNTTVPPRRLTATGVPADPATGSLQSPIFPPRPFPQNPATSQRAPTELIATSSPGLPPTIIPPRVRFNEADPYAPDGLRLGNINVLPFVGVSGGYDTNPLATAGRATGSAFVQGEAGISAQSDWSRHSFNADLRGSYTDYTSLSSANRPEASVRIGTRYDVSRDLDVNFDVRGQIASETVSDINLPAGVQQRPSTYSYGAALAGTQRFNRLSVNLRGSVDRNTYDSASLGNTIVDQTDRDQNVYALRLRVGYELTPGITPFVDGTVDTRQYDRLVDRSGYRRDSNGYTARVGSTFDITRSLTGEIAAGYTTRSFSDGRLSDLTSPVLDASLIWAISPLTALRIRATSDLEDTITAGSSGIFNRRLALDIEHALLRNLSLGLNAEVRQEDTQNSSFSQDTYTAGVRADYRLSKSLVFRSSYTFQRLSSSFAGGSYSSHLVLFGIRLQR